MRVALSVGLGAAVVLVVAMAANIAAPPRAVVRAPEPAIGRVKPVEDPRRSPAPAEREHVPFADEPLPRAVLGMSRPARQELDTCENAAWDLYPTQAQWGLRTQALEGCRTNERARRP